MIIFLTVNVLVTKASSLLSKGGILSEVVAVILKLLSTLILIPVRLTQLTLGAGYPVALQYNTRLSDSTTETFPVTCTMGGTIPNRREREVTQ